MGIGQQQPLSVKNHTASLASLHPGTRRRRTRNAEEMAEQGIHQQPLRQAPHA